MFAGKAKLFVSNYRTSKFAVTTLANSADRETMRKFLEHVFTVAPYHIHALLTDNDNQFPEQPCIWDKASSRQIRFNMLLWRPREDSNPQQSD